MAGNEYHMTIDIQWACTLLDFLQKNTEYYNTL